MLQTLSNIINEPLVAMKFATDFGRDGRSMDAVSIRCP